MADDTIQISPDSTGKKVDNSSLTVGSNTVYRQRVNIADPTSAAAITAIMNSIPTGTEYGLVVRSAGVTPIRGAPQTTTTGSITSASIVIDGTTDLSTAGNISVSISGTYAGVNIAFEMSPDLSSSTNWVSVAGARSDTYVMETTSGLLTNVSRSWNFSMQGYSRFRIRTVAWSSGTAVVVSDPGTGWFTPNIASNPQGPVPIGSAPISNPIYIAGTDGSVIRPIYVTAKNTQAALATATQDLKDSGRTRVSIVFQAAAPATADTLLSLTKYSNGVAATAATSTAVASGKTLRITSIVYSMKSGAASASSATITLRSNPTGATVISSPSELRVDLGNTSAIASAPDIAVINIPDGIEFSGTQTLGISLLASATTNVMSLSLIGFEY